MTDSDNSLCPSSSSPPSSPSSRTSISLHQTPQRLPNLALDPNQIATIAHRLHDTLCELRIPKHKSSISVSMNTLEDIIVRSQQLALLTSSFATTFNARENGPVAEEIARMSSAISHRLGNIESRLKPSTQDNHPTTAVNGIRHATLYLQDGNIVLVAGSPQIIFRVHRSMLSRQSDFFATMFTLPGPDRECYDGAPLIFMQDDPQAVESLLNVLYDPSQLPYKRLAPETPLRVRHVLAIATKYEMDALRDRIVTQLEADWPYTLRGWDRLESEIEGLIEEDEDGDVDGLHIDDKLPEPCAAVRLAVECSIPKILPSALYHLSRLDIQDDWLESRKDDSRSTTTNRTARWDLLVGDDFRLLLKLRNMIASFEYDDIYTTSLQCRSSDECHDGWQRIRNSWTTATDPLDELKCFIQDRPSALCKHCWSTFQDGAQTKRGELWNAICLFVEKEC
ncbi:BTB domain-containing protein [Mycena indigotica]|uniref:BTB domain-containing protein n=1 Tax=Mycena indigotica TaxID=2126181 RepID=A0A8H6W3T0_9AGAR|nr:BTB domain-containing protein [Mycena indigotica]KAF7301876.1 BTB domain-containing protein [Mycena indigotica]